MAALSGTETSSFCCTFRKDSFRRQNSFGRSRCTLYQIDGSSTPMSASIDINLGQKIVIAPSKLPIAHLKVICKEIVVPQVTR
jgi:hypothetical protein